MDKRIGYVHFSKGSNADQPCACSYKNGDPCHWKGDECERVAFVDSDELAKVEAEARIGRAVREFVTRQKTADYYRRTTSDYERGYKDAVDAVEIAITKAREGKADG